MTNPTHGVRCLFLSMLIGASAACSEQHPEVVANQPPPITPRMDQNARTIERTEGIVSAEVAAGGFPTTYQAHFSGDQLLRISETRAHGAAEPARGAYEFHGGRLLKYSGPSLTGSAPLELEFDLQGQVIVAHAGAGDASPQEISGIRDRAQLLRSHALTQRASRTH